MAPEPRLHGVLQPLLLVTVQQVGSELTHTLLLRQNKKFAKNKSKSVSNRAGTNTTLKLKHVIGIKMNILPLNFYGNYRKRSKVYRVSVLSYDLVPPPTPFLVRNGSQPPICLYTPCLYVHCIARLLYFRLRGRGRVAINHTTTQKLWHSIPSLYGNYIKALKFSLYCKNTFPIQYFSMGENFIYSAIFASGFQDGK